jgi:formate hydrogenlyase subunit 3/multisubunit Na+/H+ antiporter MnhD subunit
VLQERDAPVLVLVFLVVAFWAGGAVVARVGRLFIPLSLAMASLLIAALAVEPFLYAALMIELTVLLSIPVLSDVSKGVGRGILRFLTYQTLGMLFILFAGWAIPVGEVSATNTALVVRVGVLLGLGFSLLLAIFPFHTWVPMIMMEAHPYAAAFVFFILSLGITFFGIELLQRYPWLQTMPGIFPALRLVGALMAGMGGLWAAFQRHLGRMLGYAVIFETGLSLLAMGTASFEGGFSNSVAIIFASVIPRGISFGLWALALSLCVGKDLSFGEALRFRLVQGAGRKSPLVLVSLILASLSVSGFPLLAAYPVRLGLWLALGQQAAAAAIIALIGSAGLVAGSLRALAVLVIGNDEFAWQLSERPLQALLLAIGSAALVLIGVMPQWFLTPLIQIGATFLSGIR